MYSPSLSSLYSFLPITYHIHPGSQLCTGVNSSMHPSTHLSPVPFTHYQSITPVIHTLIRAAHPFTHLLILLFFSFPCFSCLTQLLIHQSVHLLKGLPSLSLIQPTSPNNLSAPRPRIRLSIPFPHVYSSSIQPSPPPPSFPSLWLSSDLFFGGAATLGLRCSTQAPLFEA